MNTGFSHIDTPYITDLHFFFTKFNQGGKGEGGKTLKNG